MEPYIAHAPHGFHRGARRQDIDSKRLEELLRQVQQGRLDVGEALNRLRTLPYEDLGFAKLDHHRDLRTGFPEVVYAPGKTLEQLTRIARSMAESSSRVLITRAGRRRMRPSGRRCPRPATTHWPGP